MFPSRRIKEEALHQSLLSDANKAYAKLCDIYVDGKRLYAFAKTLTKSFYIQIVHHYRHGPNLPKQLGPKALEQLELCKQALRTLMDTPFPDEDDPELIALHKFCIASLTELEKIKYE
jgi:hypothetical protein